MTFTPGTDELLDNNRSYAARLHESGYQTAPVRQLAVVACMDCRLDAFAVLGLRLGDAHIIRNAGGVISDDVIRSLCLSQRALGTREIILLHHTDCGLQGLDEGAFRAELEAEIGIKPTWSLETFGNAQEDVRQSMRRLVRSPFVAHTDHLRGFVFDVQSGLLEEVT